MTLERSDLEICFETPNGRVCLPIAATGPNIPSRQDDSLQLGDRLIISESAQELRRMLDFEALLIQTLKSCHGDPIERREELARILRREAEIVFERAESANLRAAPYFFHSQRRWPST